MLRGWAFCTTFLIGKVYYQEQVAKRIKNSLTRIAEPSGHVILRRPYHIGWFTNQVSTCVRRRCDILSPALLTTFGFGFFVIIISSRCLSLWEGDRELLRALELAKSFLAPTEVLNSLWPCNGTFSLSLLLAFSDVNYLVYVCIARVHVAFHLQGKALRAKLSQACASAGIPPPSPPTTPDFAATLHHHHHHHHSSSRRAVTS
jgi:hypothetical protein